MVKYTMATFTGTGTATDSTTAEDLAIEAARSQAFETFGADTQFYGVDNLYVKIEDVGGELLYRATFTTQAQTGVTPPEVNTEDTTDTTNTQQDQQITDSPANVPTDTNTEQREETVQTTAPAPVPPSESGYSGVAYDDDGNLMPGYTLDEYGNPVYVGGDFVEPATQAQAAADRAAAAETQAKLKQAQNQSTIAQRYNATSKGDWRVRLRIAPNAPILYNDSSNTLLKPLSNSDGVVFPYTPTIQTNYTANYDKYDLVHSNYRGYFYKNSAVGDINITGTFTAQDSNEARYMLAVIHFFRSVTKMFYGQDLKYRGTPPPLVYLSGFGQYQFNNHPCLVSNFTYNLPNDVDYIGISPNNQGINLADRSAKTSSSPLAAISSVITRLQNAGLLSGGRSAVAGGTDLGVVNQTVNGTGETTYVPTKMDITITLLPVQTRSQVSQQFSLKDFSNGSLLSKGFW